MSVDQITQTGARIHFDINREDIIYAGAKISTIPNSTTSTCNYSYQEPYDYTIESYHRDFTTLEPGTTYYYRACAQSESQVNYQGDEFNFTTPTENEGNIVIETQPAENITDSSVLLKLKVIGIGVVSSGFKIGTGIDFQTGKIIDGSGNPEVCFYINNEIHNNGGYYTDTIPVQSNTNYYFQGCGKNSAGTEFLGEIDSFTSLDQEPQNNENQILCEVDYVEFKPYNGTSPELSPGNPLFDTFVDSYGKEVNLIVHPKDPSKCSGVSVNGIGLYTYTQSHPTGPSLEVKSFNNPGAFDSNGQFSIKLIAGDKRGCVYEREGLDGVCRVIVKFSYGHRSSTNSAPRVFLSEGPISSINSSYTTQQPSSHIGKGTLLYRKKAGDRDWKIWQAGDPQNNGTTIPTYDSSSPCYLTDTDPETTGAQEGYDENCYELLAPIPGIGDIVKGDRIAIGNLKDYQLGEYVNTLFQVAISILMVLAVIMIIVAGVEYMTVESIYGKSKAKSHIIGAVAGLILALGIFLIIKTINPRLLEVNFGSGIDVAKITVEKDISVSPQH